MDWTEQEKKIAKELTQPETMKFLEKVFVQLKTSNGEELKKNIVALNNAQYGELMKVLYLVEKESKAKLNLIKKIASSPQAKKNMPTVAPR
jgi:hypothetical protein